MFVTWDDDSSLKIALASMGRGESISRVREESTRSDYEAYRPSESRPKDFRAILKSCNNVYRKVSLIHNIIDLMADFTVQGIEVVHPKAYNDKLCKEWARKIRLKHVSERFANMLYRQANVPVRRFIAKVRAKDIERLKKAKASADIELDDPPKVYKNEIPIKYSVLDPSSFDVIGGNLALFAGVIRYALKLGTYDIAVIKNPKNPIDKELVDNLPEDLVKLIRSGAKVIPMDPERFRMFHYKKDDSQLWAEPMTYALMDDLILLDKLKRADLAALDGAISHIRLWRLGSLEHRIMPTPAAISQLAEILANNVGGGAIDLIWGPDLDVKDIISDIHKFLGREKYAAPLESIYAGLGVPPTLTGSANASGFTNNFISLKTLTERLNYGRSILREFWEHEFRLFAEGMRMSEPPQLRFSHMTLSDEAAELALLIQLLDRGIISDETVLERFHESPVVEEWRIRRDQKKRETEKKPAKVGPYHTDTKKEMQKRLLEQGVVAPSEVGVSLKDKKPGEKTPAEVKIENQMKLQKDAPPKDRAGKGRPLNSKDSGKRKRKRVTPRTSAAKFSTTFTWAREAQKIISDVVNPVWLETCGKKDMRKLSHTETDQIEDLKFALLCSLVPFEQLDAKAIAVKLQNSISIPEPVSNLCKETVSTFMKKYGKEPTIGEMRDIQTSIYVFYKGNLDGED
jgi:hypothetical protein